MSEITNIQDKQNNKNDRLAKIINNLIVDLYGPETGLYPLKSGVGVSPSFELLPFSCEIVIRLKPENYKPVIAG